MALDLADYSRISDKVRFWAVRGAVGYVRGGLGLGTYAQVLADRWQGMEVLLQGCYQLRDLDITRCRWA